MAGALLTIPPPQTKSLVSFITRPSRAYKFKIPPRQLVHLLTDQSPFVTSATAATYQSIPINENTSSWVRSKTSSSKFSVIAEEPEHFVRASLKGTCPEDVGHRASCHCVIE